GLDGAARKFTDSSCSVHRSLPSVGQEESMSKNATDHHNAAAEHHEMAAEHHRKAAEHHDDGNHEKAAHHAHVAQGHLHHATHHAAEAAKSHLEDHGKH